MEAVKGCPYGECPRNTDRIPVLFDRRKNLSNIRFVVVSQEPGATLRKRSDPKNRLIRECGNREGRLPKGIGEIFDRAFNPETDDIYWTHSLKCIPRTNRDIRKEWKVCSPNCVNHLKSEFSIIAGATASNELMVITVGRYALAMCRHIFEGADIDPPGKLLDYICETDDGGRIHHFEGKVIRLFPFVHPSYRKPVLKRYNREEEVNRKEGAFKQRLRG